MIKAYLDSYNTITVIVSKEYYVGKISSLYLLTQYGPEVIGTLNLVNNDKDCVEYKVNTTICFDIGEEYYLVDEHGFKFLLEYRYIVKDETFIKDTYTSDCLGYEYSKESTIFNLWAPISKEVILVLNNKEYYKMQKNNSVFRYTAVGDLDNAEYYFMVKNNGVYNKVLDPYSYSYNFDQTASVVVDLNSLIETKLVKNSKKSKVIYEANVRDFSSSKKGKYKRKFLGLIDEESLDHLSNLGIEYLQLMPINYFNGDVYNNENFYNWGYNPNLYGVAHPNYVYNLENSKSVINECKLMVNELHNKGIKVVMDVVFNHLENRSDNNLNLIVPNYYYLIKNSEYSNGSYCGVDLDSDALMMRRLVIDMCKRWIKLYGIDGFRFDLMGILSVDAMNEIYNSLKEIKNDIFIYGEGWDMPSLLDEDRRASINNASKIKNIALFNDYYRESLKYDYLAEDVIKGNYKKDNKLYFKNNQSINYLECHDNYTYYDLQTYVELRDDKLAKKRQLFKNLIIILSNGYAFLHSGQEFFRTKKGVENSYCSLDNVNAFDWNRLYKHSKEVNLVEKMIKIREKHYLFDVDYEYKNDNGVIYLGCKGLEIVINLSDKNIFLDDKEIMLTTSDKKLTKYDLVVYKKRGV